MSTPFTHLQQFLFFIQFVISELSCSGTTGEADSEEEGAGSSGVPAGGGGAARAGCRGLRGESARPSTVPSSDVPAGGGAARAGGGGEVRGGSARPSTVPSSDVPAGGGAARAGGRGEVRGESARPSSAAERAQLVTAAVLEGQQNIIEAMGQINRSLINLTECISQGVERICSVLQTRPNAD